MTSQLNYLLARQQQHALADRAERVRQSHDGEPPVRTRRGQRLIGPLLAALSLRRPGWERPSQSAAALREPGAASLGECPSAGAVR